MKKFLLVISLATFACAGLFAQVSFEKTYTGQNIKTPADIDKLEIAILASLNGYGWQVESKADGEITAKFEKGHGKVMVTIKVEFSSEGYTITYVDSKGMDVNLKKMKIHGNYLRWTRNLIKDIGKRYFRQ